MKKIRFAIIGCGRIAYRHIEAIEQNPGAELAALCDLNLARAEERRGTRPVKIYRDYREMLTKENVDVVSIMTPSGMHGEHAIDIVRNFKKHVLVEKPVVLNIQDGAILKRLAQKNKVRVFAVHQNRFNKAIRKIRSAIDGKLAGRIALATVRIRWSRGQSYYDRDPWRGTWALDGGAMTNQAIHHIDLLRWLVGDVVSVSAIASTQFVNVEVEDTAVAWLRFKNGALGAIEATTATRPLNQDLEASISILGEHGTVIVEGAAVNKLKTWTFDAIDLNEHSESPPNVYGFGHDEIVDNVVETLRGKAEPLVSLDDAMKTVRLLHALYSSIEKNGKEMFLSASPVSKKLGFFSKKYKKICDLYRTEQVLKKELS